MTAVSVLTPAFDEGIAAYALALARPSIELAMLGGAAKRSDLFITISRLEKLGEFTHLACDSYGDRSEWEYPYENIAGAKHDMTVRTGLSSREVQLLHPELIRELDSYYWGSVIFGNIVVAASGVQAWFDEAFATMTASFCRALCQSKLDAIQQMAPNANSFHFHRS